MAGDRGWGNARNLTRGALGYVTVYQRSLEVISHCYATALTMKGLLLIIMISTFYTIGLHERFNEFEHTATFDTLVSQERACHKP